MAWTKSYDRVRDVHGNVIANVRVIVDYNGTKNRIAALLEVKDYQTTGIDITIDPSDAAATTWEEGVDFTAETSKAITAEHIATAIDSETNFTAHASTGHEGNPWVSIVYTAGGYLSSISTTNTAIYKFYSEDEATIGVPKLAQDDVGTIKHQPLWTDSNGLYSFYIDAPVNIDINYLKSGYSFDNTYREDAVIAIEDVVEDTTPQLGGNLDAQGNSINNTLNIEIGNIGSGTTKPSTQDTFELQIDTSTGTNGELNLVWNDGGVKRTISLGTT